MKTIAVFSAFAFVLGVAQAVPTPYAHLVPRVAPGVPSAEDARSKLGNLTVAVPRSGEGYSRSKFPHWRIQHGECNTREEVLKRDGVNVVTNAKCAATSGTWVCPYTNNTYTKSSDIDIDHMVPLKNAWISGASNWTTERRGDFANDLQHPQLWAVKDTVNQGKSDSSPDVWQPPLESFHCTYASAWVEVKSVWSLTVTEAEKASLEKMLSTCSKPAEAEQS
ncbi:hypothetical protein TWF696_004835 [Orbilia brochopaga]|uniref:GmrSD restriction endonucleases C-terminal domain-containing protein n=1 Tax=Orbilia brochopaga TaxID=3140254 RepID=A0AAV9V1Z5_9PEZI